MIDDRPPIKRDDWLALLGLILFVGIVFALAAVDPDAIAAAR